MKSLILLSVCIAVFVGHQHVRGAEVHRRYKRGTCDSKYSKLDAGHTMCLGDSADAKPSPFKADEKQTIVDQHNALRAKAKAAGMMKMVWDDDVAKVAQKWSQQCKQGHEKGSILRATPSLNGIMMGQNVAYYGTPGYSYKDVTALWHNEINYFSYGTGLNTPGKSIGHYTQVVLENAARIGCGRTTCGKQEIVTCNYVTGQSPYQQLKPYEMCSQDSCKSKCLARDSNGLCDCKGKVCLNNGKLDKSTCTCKCGPYTEGPSCQTMNCAGATDGNYVCPEKYCHFSSIAAVCPVTCKFCPDCDKVCQNGGTQNTAPCLCDCPPGFTGDLCEKAVNDGPKNEAPVLACRPCQNNGKQDSSTCKCTCPKGFTGSMCETTVDPNDKVRNCYILRKGVRVYRGTQSKSNSNFTCQKWAKTSPHSHKYTDKFFDNTDGEFPENTTEAGNYCRDPSSGRTAPAGRLWCYNEARRGARWDWCDNIPAC